MSSIVTFYSYKGGVGRSMALSNIAFELSKKGKNILIVDWDLEAPGLEKYFSNYSTENAGAGLLPLLIDVNKDIVPDYKKYLWTIKLDADHKIDFLHSGREKDPGNYSNKFEHFDWDDFFKDKAGGIFLEKLRNEWKKDYDIVLVDSRTGLSDSSGICTILLPDIVIPMFTANNQSLYGVRDIMRYAQAARQKIAIDRSCLTILPVPSRFGTRVEYIESQKWLDQFAEALKEFYTDWLPKWIEPKYMLEQIKIPQVDYFSFGEKLAVAEQGTSDPEGMGYVYSRIASLLASDFVDLVSFIGVSHYDAKKLEYDQKKLTEKETTKVAPQYEHDVFISHSHDSISSEWLKEFLPVLNEYLHAELGRPPRVFIDVTEIYSDKLWIDSIAQALQKSNIFLPIVTHDYLSNTNNLYELEIFSERESHAEKTLIIPVAIKKLDFNYIPATLQKKQIADFSEFNIEELKKSTRLKVRFAQEVEKIAIQIASSIHETVPQKVFNVQKIQASEKEDQTKEIKILANEYEELRKIMKPSNHRTKQMESITTKMKAITLQILPVLPTLIKSESPGERLAAIAALQEKPAPVYLDWLAEHVGDTEKPFIGYQASVGIYIAARSIGHENKKEVQSAIKKAFKNLDKSEYKDPNQISVLNAAKFEIGYK